jgi:membrane associated rhomboid family serine protease
MPFSSKGSALGFVVVWMVLNFFFGMLRPEALGIEGGGVAWETHLGGFIFGFIGISWFDGQGLPPNRFEFAPPTHS